MNTHSSIDRTQALNRLQAQCARAEKCTGDIRRKMQQWRLPEADAEWVMRQLVADGFVDDTRYATSFVRSKAQYSQWGRIKIRAALRAKGLAESLIAQALADFPADTDRETLSELLARKLPQIRAKSPYDLKAKLVRFGVSRGFELDMVLSEADRLVRGVGED